MSVPTFPNPSTFDAAALLADPSMADGATAVRPFRIDVSEEDYDWCAAEATLNALPQFVTEIYGLDIHFIHVRPAHPDALPLIMTHGCPGSVPELVKVIGPLIDPTAHGGRAEDAFDLVWPRLPEV